MSFKNVIPVIQKIFYLWTVWFSKICYDFNSTFNYFLESFPPTPPVEMYNQIYTIVKWVIWSNSLNLLHFQLAF